MIWWLLLGVIIGIWLRCEPKKYETEEEEVSKTIRCIINFIDDEPDKISI